MNEEKNPSDWGLWGAFLASIVLYGYLGIRVQMDKPPLSELGDRVSLVWVLAAIAVSIIVAGIIGSRFIENSLGKNMLRWGIYNSVAVLGLFLAFLSFPSIYWLPFPLGAAALMGLHNPRRIQ